MISNKTLDDLTMAVSPSGALTITPTIVPKNNNVQTIITCTCAAGGPWDWVNTQSSTGQTNTTLSTQLMDNLTKNLDLQDMANDLGNALTLNNGFVVSRSGTFLHKQVGFGAAGDLFAELFYQGG